jgi:hypothetical protein
MEMESWTASQLNFIGYGNPGETGRTVINGDQTGESDKCQTWYAAHQSTCQATAIGQTKINNDQTGQTVINIDQTGESDQCQAWSAARQSLGQAAIVLYLARWQKTLECNALIGHVTWLGAVSEWSAADIDTIT